MTGGQAFPSNLPDLNPGHLIFFYSPTGAVKAVLNSKDAQINKLLGERVFLRSFIQAGRTSRVIRTLPSGEQIMLLLNPVSRPTGVTNRQILWLRRYGCTFNLRRIMRLDNILEYI